MTETFSNGMMIGVILGSAMWPLGYLSFRLAMWRMEREPGAVRAKITEWVMGPAGHALLICMAIAVALTFDIYLLYLVFAAADAWGAWAFLLYLPVLGACGMSLAFVAYVIGWTEKKEAEA